MGVKGVGSAGGVASGFFSFTVGFMATGTLTGTSREDSGTLLAFVPASRFRLERGEDATTDYQFNKHVIHHLFCKTCGIKSFSRGMGKDGPTVAINVRCLDGFEPSQFQIKEIDGRSR